PPFVVIVPAAFDLATGGRRDALTLIRLQVPLELTEELHTVLPQLGGESVRYAVRSSALDEDGAAHSFAGQLDSVLEVAIADLPAAIIKVWRSGFSERVMAYRKERGLAGPPQAPAVIVQGMVSPTAAGVAFGVDPVSGQRHHVVIAAVPGLADQLVSGEVDSETFVLGPDGAVLEHRLIPGATELVLDLRHALLIMASVRTLARLLGPYQEIEWAVAEDHLWILQTRPITSLGNLADPAGLPGLWDNSNIAESYNGVTTPLTFSFARTAYDAVYRDFCRVMGVEESRIAASDQVFAHMIGLIRGRVYYNLHSWYRVLALLPGFAINRHFMEQMMGVKEGIPEAFVQELLAGQRTSFWGERWRVVRMLLHMWGELRRLPRNVEVFKQRLNTVLSDRQLDLLRVEELAAYYRELEAQLLRRWDTPLVNDFFAMVFYGLLRRLCEKWCGDSDGTLQNDLIARQGGIISAEPARLIREMAALAATSPEFAQLLVDCTTYDTIRKSTLPPAGQFRVLLD
ncbi:MAG: PEP/pyruvate-binding domain-containing protein, partial [bacterium]